MTSIPRSRHPKPASTSSVRTISTTYIREFGNWKAGAFVVPAFGTTSLRNKYSIQGISGIKRQDNLNTNNGFRLGFKAGVWYQDIGVSVGYNPVIGKNSGQVPMYKFYANRHFGEVLSA